MGGRDYLNPLSVEAELDALPQLDAAPALAVGDEVQGATGRVEVEGDSRVGHQEPDDAGGERGAQVQEGLAVAGG